MPIGVAGTAGYLALNRVAPWLGGTVINDWEFPGLPLIALSPTMLNAAIAATRVSAAGSSSTNDAGSNITAGEELGYVDFDIPLGQPNPDYQYGGVLGNVVASIPGAVVSAVGNGSVGDEPPFPGAPVSDRPPFPEGSIYGPGGTWGETPLPPGIYDIPIEDTRPGEIPPPPIPEEGGPASRDIEGDQAMATDWGDFISQTTQDFITGFVGGGGSPSPTVGAGGVAPPARVTVDTRTGAVTPCKRRRRRRLLTSSDLNDLAALKTIVGGGQALNGAVIKAVRR